MASHAEENRSSSEDKSTNEMTEKEKQEELETIHTNERVGSHENYYEKGGLRTEGDGQDHVGTHNKVCDFLHISAEVVLTYFFTAWIQRMDVYYCHVLLMD